MIKAKKADFERLYAIILECSSWLKSEGIAQWNPPYPEKRFMEEIEKGKVFYFLEGKEIIGTATLLKRKPDYYAGDPFDNKEKAWYICRLAVPRKLKNRSMGIKILSEIEEKAVKSGLRALRLDIPKSNPFLEMYYTKLGFRNVGNGVLRGTPSFFMEKRM